MHRFPILMLVLVLHFCLKSQHEYSNWIFGDKAGITFTPSSVSAISGLPFSYGDNTNSISSNIGNLLFYANGMSMYTAAHTSFPGQAGFTGPSSPAGGRSGVIVKRPGNNAEYFFLTISSAKLEIAVINMSLAAGLGSLTASSTPVFTNNVVPAISVTKHCNNIDYWVAVKAEFTNTYYMLLLTANGITSPPVINSIGQMSNAWGYLKFSPSGRLFASSTFSTNLSLFDFDRSTGILSNYKNITSTYYQAPLAFEFSPNEQFLYSTSIGTNQLWQWSLCSGNAASISATQYTVANTGAQKWDLQIGRDGKIYICRYNQNALAVINNPNQPNASCNYVEIGQPLGLGICELTFPNILSCSFANQFSPLSYSFSPSPANCRALNFTVAPVAVGCPNTNTNVLYKWHFDDMPALTFSNTTQLTTSHSFSSSGSHSVMLVRNWDCATDTLIQFINVPGINYSLSIAPLTCSVSGNAIFSPITNSATPNYSIAWLPSGATSPTLIAPATGNHTLQVSDLSSACQLTESLSIGFVNTLTTSIQSLSITCFGQSTGATTAIVGGGSGNYQYTWTPGTFTNQSIASLTAGSYSVSIFDAISSCTSQAQVQINQPNLLTLTLSASQYSTCTNNPVVLSTTVSGGTQPYAFQWSNLSTASSQTITASVPTISLVTLTALDANSCSVNSSLSVLFTGSAPLSSTNKTICVNQTASLSVSGANSYTWYPSNANATLIAVNPTVSTSFLVIGTTPSCSIPSSLTVSVTVIPPPSLLIALSSKSLCAQAFNGSPNTITLTANGANTYTLYTPNLIGSSTPVTPSASLFATPPFSSTIAVGIATLQGSNGYCSSTANFVFTVIPNPTVSAASSTPVICAGQNFTYTSNGASSYIWTSTTPNYTTYSNGGIAVAHPSINAVFSVYGSSLGCQSALVTNSITVYPIPTITLSALSSSICLFDKTNLSLSGTGTSFQWLPAIGLNNYNTNSVTCGAQVNQVYTVIATANNCTAAATTSIHVWLLPTASITSASNKLCLRDNITLSGTGGLLFNWFGPDKIATAGQTVVISATSPAMAGTYTLVVTDNNGCKNSTTTLVDILPLPDGSLVNLKEEFCAPYCTNYNFVGTNSNNIQSTWLINGTSFATNKFNYCFKEAGTFTLSGKLIDNTTTCKSSLQYIFTVHPKPIADFNFLPKEPIENLDEVQFTNLSEGQGFLSYHWFFNDNKGFSTTNKNASYLYSEPGEYRVALLTKNNWGCADTVLKTITVAPDFALFVPNTFTPNDDNRNDVFLASVRSSKLFDLKIYDRWGTEIFHSKSPQDGWDGTFKGEICKQDTYTWLIELSTVSDERITKTGFVLLTR